MELAATRWGGKAVVLTVADGEEGVRGSKQPSLLVSLSGLSPQVWRFCFYLSSSTIGPTRNPGQRATQEQRVAFFRMSRAGCACCSGICTVYVKNDNKKGINYSDLVGKIG